mgnify:CR=1 FL=1
MKNRFILLFFALGILPYFAKSQTVRKYILVMRSNVGTATMWDNKVIRIYGFAPNLSAQPTLPGVTLYAEEGDSIYIEARSISQNHEHTVHLHGFDSPPKHDGDPLTSHVIGHLQGRIYAYKATHCGTFIYHCHVEDVVHVQMGMYGLLIVKPKGGLNTAWTGGPAYNKEYSWLMSEIDQKWHEDIPVMVVDTLKIPAYNPNYFLINGKSEQQITSNDSIKISGGTGEFIYLRTANIGYYINRIIFPTELNATIVDSDGRPLPKAFRNDTVSLSPGERYGVMLNCPNNFTGNILVNYVNMNSDSVWNVQKVPVNIGPVSVKEEMYTSLFEIYPNPARDELEVVLINKDDLKADEYAIINTIGQIVKNGTISKDKSINTFSINVSDLNTGVYYLRLLLKDSYLYKKVIITD